MIRLILHGFDLWDIGLIHGVLMIQLDETAHERIPRNANGIANLFFSSVTRVVSLFFFNLLNTHPSKRVYMDSKLDDNSSTLFTVLLRSLINHLR